ncbi:UbiX family flavin prenyltransferase [Sporomusa aerivorans]|uniref:UbiX family flavin prenyltransferase n=1 Tax=Sporomusa aerivorans TaxID=204936 RepID=UPI00352A9CF5
MKPIIGITAATGIIYAIRLLETFQRLAIDTCLILSREAEATLTGETAYPLSYLKSLVHDFHYQDSELLPQTGWLTNADAMIIVPCSVRSVVSMINASPLDLLQAAGSHMLSSGKKLILVPGEPVYLPEHLEIMLQLAYKGAVIMPYMPSFYHKPATIDDIVDHHTGRILDLLGIEHNLVKRWGEVSFSSPMPCRDDN